MSTSQNTILILGASRGLGLALAHEFLARGWHVIATQRERSEGLAAVKAEHPDALRIETFDINDGDHAKALRARLGHQLDILFVNAGVMDDQQPVGDVATAEYTRLLVTNALSPMRMIELFAPLVTQDGVVGAMSSGLGSVSANTSGGYEVYRASKAALNTMLRSYAARDPRRAVLAISPGWVKTAMGGDGASLEVDASARGIASVLIGRRGQPGSAFLNYQGREVPW